MMEAKWSKGRKIRSFTNHISAVAVRVLPRKCFHTTTVSWKGRFFLLSKYNKPTIWLVIEVLQYASQTLYFCSKFLDFSTIPADMHRQFHLRQEKSLIPSTIDPTSAERRGGFCRLFGVLLLYQSPPASAFVTSSSNHLRHGSEYCCPFQTFSYIQNNGVGSYQPPWRSQSQTLLCQSQWHGLPYVVPIYI